jgi:hypothetical protein
MAHGYWRLAWREEGEPRSAEQRRERLLVRKKER